MENKKKVDEAWKARVAREKKEVPPQTPSSGKELPPLDFSSFVSGLGMQALLFLGEFSDPEAKEKVKPDRQQARYMIDLIDMLKKKTEGNRTDEETQLLDNLLYNVRTKYLEHV